MDCYWFAMLISAVTHSVPYAPSRQGAVDADGGLTSAGFYWLAPWLEAMVGMIGSGDSLSGTRAPLVTRRFTNKIFEWRHLSFFRYFIRSTPYPNGKSKSLKKPVPFVLRAVIGARRDFRLFACQNRIYSSTWLLLHALYCFTVLGDIPSGGLIFSYFIFY